MEKRGKKGGRPRPSHKRKGKAVPGRETGILLNREYSSAAAKKLFKLLEKNIGPLFLFATDLDIDWHNN